MGVWAETCAISQLPIPQGTRARLVLLFRSPDYSEGLYSRCYAGHALWAPWALPLAGTYDGYGRLELEVPEWHTTLLLERFKDVSDKSPKGSKLDQFKGVSTESKLHDFTGLEAIRELLARVATGSIRARAAIDPEEEQDMGQCFIREDVYQLLANSPVYTDTAVWTAKERTDRILRDLKETEVSPLHTGALNDVLEGLADTEVGESIRATLKTLVQYRKLAEAMTGYGPTGYRGIGTYRLALSEKIMAGGPPDHPDIAEAAVQLAEFEHVLLHFEQLRRLWGPQNGSGSQTMGWESHMVLGRFIADTALKAFEDEVGLYEDPDPE